jgi:hypothetical protein
MSRNLVAIATAMVRIPSTMPLLNRMTAADVVTESMERKSAAVQCAGQLVLVDAAERADVH